MSKRYDVMSPRKGREKTFWTRVGTAFESEKGIQIIFDALPLPDAEGRCAVNLFEPRERDGGQKPAAVSGGGGRGFDGLDDDIAF